MRLLVCLALLVFGCAATQAQSGPVDPRWVYVAPLRWHNAPRGIDSRWAWAQVLVLYPDGQFAELDSTFMASRHGTLIHFSVGDGNRVRLGTWARTDDEVLRISSQEAFHDPETVERVTCKPPTAGSNCIRIPEPMVGPVRVDTCGLRGHPHDALTDALICPRSAFTRLRLQIDLVYLEDMIQDGVTMRKASHAPPGSTAPAPPR